MSGKDENVRDRVATVAYRTWREAQRGGPMSDAEHEAMWSRLEAGWMTQVADALANAGLLTPHRLRQSRRARPDVTP